MPRTKDPVRPQRDWALFLDIDGTLLDIAPRPDAVVVPADLAANLEAASVWLGGALAVVSGRALEAIDRLLHPLALPAGAEHGAILRLPDGAIEQRVTARVPLSWREHLHAEAREWPGVLIGDKHAGVAVHYRLAPEREAQVRDLVTRIAAADSAFEVLPARMAFEIRPRGADKGAAVRRLMGLPPFAGRVPVFVGDDLTDEDGFAAARATGGIALHVAEDFGGEPANVRRWLTGFKG